MSVLTDIQKWPGGYCRACSAILFDDIEESAGLCAACRLVVHCESAKHCAAGPWLPKKELENVQHGKLCLVRLEGFFGGVPQSLFYDKEVMCWRTHLHGGPLIAWAESTIAFATINPPEVKP